MKLFATGLSWLRSYFIRPRRMAVLTAFITLVIGFVVLFIFQNFYADYLIAGQRQVLQSDLAISGDTFESELGARTSLAETFKTFTTAELQVSDKNLTTHIQPIMQGLYGLTKGIEFFSLEMPKNALIQFPETQRARKLLNELKLNMGTDWEQEFQTESTSIYGPYSTSTGRRMLVARVGVFQDGQTWGAITVAFDLDLILTDAGLSELPTGWALVDEKGSLLAGESINPELIPVHQTILFAGKNWELQAIPPEGWRASVNSALQITRWGGVLILSLLAALISLLINRQERLRAAVDEQTHTLAAQLSERQQMTEALRNSEEQSRLIVESALDAIFIEDPEGRVLDCNEFACQMFGYSRQELLQLSAFDLIPAEEVANLPRVVSEEVAEGLRFAQSFGIRHDGEIFPTEVNIRLVDSGGKKQVVVYVRDLSERRQEQRLLAESELRYRSLVEILPDGILLTDLEGEIFFCNQRAVELHEFATPSELIGRNLFDLVLPEDRPSVVEQMKTIHAQGSNSGMKFRLLRQNGAVTWVEESASLIPGVGDQPSFILAIERDISANQEVESSQRLQTTALEAAANGIVITDLQGVIRWVNPAFTRLTGYTIQEAIGQHTRILNSGIHPPEFYETMWTEITAGNVWSGRVINRRKDGSLYTEEMTITPVFSEASNGKAPKVTHYIAIKQDVTDREQDESRQSAIATLTSALRLAVSRPEIIEIILTQTRELMEGHGAALMMRDTQDGNLICEQGVGAWENWKGVQVSGHTGATARVLATLRPFVENNVPASQEPLIRRIFNNHHAVVCIPMIMPLSASAANPGEGDSRREQVMGTLWLGRNRPFIDGEIRVLTSIADIAAGAVQRAALYDETRQRLRRLMAIHALDSAISTSLDVKVLLDELLRQLTGDLSVDAADVMLVSADGWTLRCAAAIGFRVEEDTSPHELRLGQGLAGRAALERKTMIQTAPHEEYPPVELERLAGEEVVSRVALPMLAAGELKGVLQIYYRQFMDFDPEWLEYLETLAGQAAIAIDNAQLFDRAQRSSLELTAAYDTTLEGWARALELRDRETEGHTRRASELTIKLGRRLGMSEGELVHVWRGALLHDIGKLGIPDEILSKPGPLTEEEWVVMRQHPLLGYRLLEPIPYLRPALDIPYCHHERWNGQGYPQALQGEQIPLSARIFAVADVWDALRSDRPYRAAWDGAKARNYIVQQSGIQFDPRVVQVFEQLLDEELRLED